MEFMQIDWFYKIFFRKSMPKKGYHRNAESIENRLKNNEIHITKTYLSGRGFLKNSEKNNGFSIFS